MDERETLLEIHDALLLALDATEDAIGCIHSIAEVHDHVRHALVNVVNLIIYKSPAASDAALSS